MLRADETLNKFTGLSWPNRSLKNKREPRQCAASKNVSRGRVRPQTTAVRGWNLREWILPSTGEDAD